MPEYLGLHNELSLDIIDGRGFENIKIDQMRTRQVVVRRAVPSVASSYTIRSVRYGECQKNHAVAVGGYAVDGCREFMASSEEDGTIEALTCAACGCHRNFHRREVVTNVVCDENLSSLESK